MGIGQGQAFDVRRLLVILIKQAQVLYLYPALPCGECVEIGRALLPKTLEEVHVWEWQAPPWKQAFRLK